MLRNALAEVGDWVLVERHVQQGVTRELSGYLGSLVVRVDAVGVLRLGIDLRRARVVDVDHDPRAVTIVLADARASGFKCIDLFYNPKCIHQALGYLRPEQYEAVRAPVKKVA